MRAAILTGVLLLAAESAGASILNPYHAVEWNTRVASPAAARGGAPSGPQTIEVPGATWVRLSFDDVFVDEGAIVRIRSRLDGAEQRLDAVAMANWQNSSAYFNGDRVEIEILPGSESDVSRLRVSAVFVGDPRVAAPEDVCGTDDRIASTDNRVARIFPVGCTAWRIGNGAFLTAGHCIDLDPDEGGPMLPDGVSDLQGVVQFNVPPSDSAGNRQQPGPEDQFPIDSLSGVWRYDGQGQGLGKDWGIFRVRANNDTHLLPSEVYGTPLRITRELPSNGATIRITGFGADDDTANFTNQTSTGPFNGESTSGANIWLSYAVDTEGGNSGSPIIWEDFDIAVGIHTNGGCESGPNNSGTSFEVDALENAINAFGGPNVTHVDTAHPMPMTEDGTLMRPWNTLSEGVFAVPSGGTISVFPGTVTVNPGASILKALTIAAPGGPVLITTP